MKFEPIGSDTPDVYVLGDIASMDDADEMYTGKTGKTLLDMLDTQGLNKNNCRFNYIVRTKLFDTNGGKIDSTEAAKQCIKHFEDDFEAHKPKVLIVVGFTAARQLFNIKIFSDDKKNIFEYKGVPTVLVNHVNFIQNHDTESKDLYNEFVMDIHIARNIAMGVININNIEFANIVRENKSKTVPCLTYKDFDDFCKEYIDKYDTVAYDIETNAAEVHSVYHEVVGFSLASNKDVGCYTVLSSLDYEMSDEDRVLVENRIRDILDTKRVIVYNCQHEIPATLNWLGIEMSKVDDVFVQVKLMTGSASDKYRGTRGLKSQASTHLKYDDWSADLDKYMDYVDNFAVNKDSIRELVSVYYEESEIDNVMMLIENNVDKFVKSVGADVISYGYVPYKLIARYGSIDASVLFELRDYYLDWMKREGETLGIDLSKGYEYWMQHHYAGYTLEKNGAYWNDDKAEEINQWCYKGLIDAQKELIRSPLSQNFLRSNFKERFQKYLMEFHIESILGDDFTPDRMCKTSINVIALTNEAKQKLADMSLRPITRKNKNGEEVPIKNGNHYKLKLGNVYTLAQDFLAQNPTLFDDWYKRTIDDYLNEEHTIEEYKAVLNPNATSAEFREFVSNILVTETIRYAKFYRSIQQLTEDPAYDIDLYKDFVNSDGRIDNSHKRWGFDIKTFKLENPSYTYQDTKDSELIKLIDKLRVDDKFTISDKFEMFLKHIAANGITYKTYQIKKLYNSCMNYKMETLDAVALNDIYEMYLMCRMDVEDKSTWDDKFAWLYYYKMYKKYAKTISTYINGNVGRGNAFYVDTSDFENNVYMPKRQELYEGKKENKSLLVQQNFKINMAATGRWQCGMHNLPAGPGIKSIFTSRYKGGCIAMPDGSQMEIRVLSVESGDENLIQAFKDGVDIHRFFASKIFNRPYDEVEKWQRGLAKNAVFGMIYGESEKTFADSYLHGDLSAAQKVFNDMFTGFPKIKTYIDRAHEQYEKFGKVTTLTQRYINLDDPRQDHNAILRQSQNFPIQASAEDIAGLILYKLCIWLKENNMRSKPFCFIHDSIEIDIYPPELLKIYDKINYLFNVYPMQEFNAPVECDVPFGMSMGEECVVEDMDCDEAFNEATFVLKGYLDEMDDLIENWKTVYKVVEVLDKFEDEVSEEYVPWSNVFLAKKSTLSMLTGTKRYKGARKVHLVLE